VRQSSVDGSESIQVLTYALGRTCHGAVHDGKLTLTVFKVLNRDLANKTVIMLSDIPCVLLAGGLGTRLSEETSVRPKPMVEIGERPIIWHLMKNLSSWGLREYIVALGYKGEEVKRFFMEYRRLCGSISIDFSCPEPNTPPPLEENWLLHLVDTGLSSMTGGRIRRAHSYIANRTFLMTYADGLADVDISALVDFHKSHGKLATVTAVRPPARFGGLDFDGDRVTRFLEKPQTGEGWINGGFFVLEPDVLSYIEGDDTVWERGPLERIAQDGELMAFRHDGFFQPMDTLRDKKMLQELWDSRRAPWMTW
jgi:glucose-1-phosphate cytidylyltransferase